MAFRAPEDIWRQVFSEVTHSDVKVDEVDGLYPSAPILYPSLILSAVCHSWRTITHDHTLLWRTIHLATGSFTASEAMRIRHYIELSKNRPLRILVEVPRSAPVSASCLDLMKNSLRVLNGVEILIVRGGKAGRAVIMALAQCLSPPNALTIAFTDGSYHSLDPNSYISINLERLKLRKCSPFPIGALDVGPHPRKLRRLEVRNELSNSFNWRTFRTTIGSVAGTLQDLVYVGGFYSTREHDCGVGPTVLTHLTSLTAELEVVLLFYTSKIYTPALQSLIVVVLRPFLRHTEWWKEYANDPKGGRNITAVTFEQNGKPSGPFHLGPIEHLPKLRKLSLRSPNVGLILDGLNICAQSRIGGSKRSSGRALKALRVLSITDYDGDGQKLATFVRNYHQGPLSDSDMEFDSTFAEGSNVLKVELRNCPNISTEVLAELREIGSIPVGPE